MDNSTVSRKTLGRSPSLCDLYDVRRDLFCGVSLLNSVPPEAAITSVEVPEVISEYTNQYSYHDKFQQLGVEAGLKISVLSGLLDLSGSGAYLTDEATSQKVVRGTLIYKITTKEESINLLHDELRNQVIVQQLLNPEATHLVSKIRWGASLFVTLEKKVQNYSRVKEVEGILKSGLTKIASRLKDTTGEGALKYSDIGLLDLDGSFSVRVNGDVVPNQPPLQSIEQAWNLINNVPQYIKEFYQGKGKPLEVELYPLKLLQPDHFGAIVTDDKIKHDIDNATIREVESEIDNSVLQMQILNDFVKDVKECCEYASDDDLYECLRYHTRAKTALAKFRAALKQDIIAIRKTGASISVLDNAIQKYHLDPHSAINIPIFIGKKSVLREKMDFFQVMKEKGVDFLPKHKPIESFVAQHDKQMVYVLFYADAVTHAEKEKWQNAYFLFLELKERSEALDSIGSGDVSAVCNTNQENTKFLVVDESLLHCARGTESSFRIVQYSHGRLVTNDFAMSDKDTFFQNIILFKRIDKMGSPPAIVSATRLICPLAIQSKCDAHRRLWVCYRCNENMQYGFDNHFYCNCGGVLLEDCQFKCYDPRHGPQFKSFENVEKLQEQLPKAPDSEHINILLLGQTGVGKTTWINALRNYLEYRTLQEAIKGEVKVLVPSKFVQGDTEVLVGEADPDQEASTSSNFAGQSSTQSCRSHVFSMDDMTIQIIDTPGIGDVRGIAQDKENMEHILQYINKEEHLHGICILLKPNESRLTPDFMFCLTSLLTNLHKNAANNILFCYTNTRGTLYSYGDTNGLVTAMLSKIKSNYSQEIPYDKRNTFFFDSESFRLLACIQQKMQFPETTIDAFSGSWDNAVVETFRLIATIQENDPHVVAETVSLNDARKLITVLSRPLAEIANTIASHIAKIDHQSQKIRQTVNDEEQLKECLTRHIEQLEVVPLDYPRTVCTSSSCISVVNNAVEFSTVCHDHCYLKNVPHDTIGHPALSYCICMDRNTETCTNGNCRCPRLLHQHITYITRRVTIPETDESVEKQIAEKRSTKEIVRSKMAQLAKDIQELEAEKSAISSASAAFAVFLEQNAITPFNDSIDQYLQSMIEQRNLIGEIKEMKELEKIRKQYEVEKELYEMNLAVSISYSLLPSTTRKKLSPGDVPTVLEELNKLPRSGPKLREQLEVSNSCVAQFESRHRASTFSKPKLTSDKRWLRKMRNVVDWSPVARFFHRH